MIPSEFIRQKIHFLGLDIFFLFFSILHLVYTITLQYMAELAGRDRILNCKVFDSGSVWNCHLSTQSHSSYRTQVHLDSAPWRMLISNVFWFPTSIFSQPHAGTTGVLQNSANKNMERLNRISHERHFSCMQPWTTLLNYPTRHLSSPSVKKPHSSTSGLEDCLSYLSLQLWSSKEMCTYWIHSSLILDHCVCRHLSLPLHYIHLYTRCESWSNSIKIYRI